MSARILPLRPKSVSAPSKADCATSSPLPPSCSATRPALDSLTLPQIHAELNELALKKPGQVLGLAVLIRGLLDRDDDERRIAQRLDATAHTWFN